MIYVMFLLNLVVFCIFVGILYMIGNLFFDYVKVNERVKQILFAIFGLAALVWFIHQMFSGGSDRFLISF